MRRFAMLLGLSVLLVVAAAGIAVAAIEVADLNNKQCNDDGEVCMGTDERDLLHEHDGSRSDRIYALAENDTIDANNFRGEGDLGDGGPGRDTILLNDGDGADRARGGRGRDVCYVDPGDTSRSCIRRETTTTSGLPAGKDPTVVEGSTG